MQIPVCIVAAKTGLVSSGFNKPPPFIPPKFYISPAMGKRYLFSGAPCRVQNIMVVIYLVTFDRGASKKNNAKSNVKCESSFHVSHLTFHEPEDSTSVDRIGQENVNRFSFTV